MSDPVDPRWTIAPSVSEAARVKLEMVRAFITSRPPPKIPQTLADFDAAAERGAEAADMLGRAALAALSPVTQPRVLGGTPVLEVRPKAYADDASCIVYIHGGGFVGGSAKASLLTSALIAATSGRRVISIDYTLAPRGVWTTILDQVTAAWSALLAERGDKDAARGVGMIGDSAGGCIAAASCLLLRERGLPLPAALILLSPATDLAAGGDTNLTLAPVDYLDRQWSEVARRAYAPNADLSDALVSPVHGDFTKPYPPTLIQAGTRELLLSDSVRLHRALRSAGRASRLEIYEGMPHVFQPFLADAPEGREAWAEMAAFWTEHL